MSSTGIIDGAEATLMPLLGVPDAVLHTTRTLDVSGLTSAEIRQAMGELRVWQGIGAALDARLREQAARLTEIADADRAGAGSEASDDGSTDGSCVGMTGDLFAGCDDPGVSPETLDADAGLSPTEGRRRQRRARCLVAFPAVAAILEEGRCSTDHVDVIAGEWESADPAVARRLLERDRDLAMAAGNRQPALLRRYVQHLITVIAAELGVERTTQRRARRSVKHWFAKGDGMGRLVGDLDAGDYQRMTDILDRETYRRMQADRTLTREQAAADALVAIVCGEVTDRSGGSGGAVGVLIDLATLTDGLHPGSVCEYVNGAPVDVAAVRTMATEAGIVPIVISGEGVPLDVGRSRRLATVAQRTALAAVHATCMVPDCDTPFDRTEIHHVTPWEEGGPTDLANLGPLCSACHHHVHDRGWSIRLLTDRSVIVTRSDGTEVRGRPDRQPRTAGAP